MSVNYARLAFDRGRHHIRFVAFVTRRKLTCMECGGQGGWTEAVLDYGVGPFEECGWCEGTGYMTPKGRGEWLRQKKAAKKAAKND